MKRLVAVGIGVAFLLTGCSSGYDDTVVPVSSPVTGRATPTPATSAPATPEPTQDTLDVQWDDGWAETPVEEITVTRVIDGDTIETDAGTVRIIGFDTPEIGECGYDEAGEKLSSLLDFETVYLVRDPIDTEDTDKYDRLLRHVLTETGPPYSPTTQGVCVGLSMIGEGYATPRYNSIDGYGLHGLEEAYTYAAATADPNVCEVPEPMAKAKPAPQPEPAAAEPWNEPGPDLDCSDIGHAVQITGPDSRGWMPMATAGPASGHER